MPLQVLIVQTDPQAAQELIEFFRERGDQIHLTTDLESTQNFILSRSRIGLALVDLHLPGDSWLQVIRLLRQQSSDTRLIVTNRYPDFHRELLAREHGIRVFLRQPFTRRWIERALDRAFETFAVGSVLAEEMTVLPPTRLPLIAEWGLVLGTLFVLLVLAIVAPALWSWSRGVAWLLGNLAIVTVGSGIYLAWQQSHWLRQMITAAIEIARGNLEVKISPAGLDELSTLSQAFNYMVSGLQENSIHRDLLGGVAPTTARDELRQAFASGNLRLDGQNVTAAVMVCDIRGFTRLAEREAPAVVVRWLNEYFSELVPIITAHGGVVDQIEGDAILAFFGILPRLLPPDESVAHACLAALEMLIAGDQVNARRATRGEPALLTGIGLSAGTVTAGGLGAGDRFNYTILGETVNLAKRLESIAREFDRSSVILSAAAYQALRDENLCRQVQSLGERTLPGYDTPLTVYRLEENA